MSKSPTLHTQLRRFQNQMSVKAAEIELRSRQLLAVLLQQQAGMMTEAEFKGAVEEIVNTVGMIEQPEYSLFLSFREHIGPYFESESPILGQNGKPLRKS